MAKDNEDYRVEVPEDIKELLNHLAQIIAAPMPAGWGFTLLMFTYDTPANQGNNVMTYISSANRNDMLTAMAEFLTNQGN